MRLFAITISLIINVCRAQSPIGQPTEYAASGARFEAADVHSSPRILEPIVRGPFFADGRYELRFATMLDLIRIAYNLDSEKILGGPSWLEWDRYDCSPRQDPAPTQSRAGGCFHLALHEDTRPMSAWALTIGGNRHMAEADDTGETGCRSTLENALPVSGYSPDQRPAAAAPVRHYTCRNITMPAFAAGLPSMAGAERFLKNKLVIGQTALNGAWSFSFHFTPTLDVGDTLFAALEKELGLKLKPTTAPMAVVVVDAVNRKPTANAPDIEKSLPGLPTEFEVASVKPSAPDSRSYRLEIKNGRISMTGATLRTLIGLGWKVYSDEMLPGAPKWLNEDRFDVMAKAPTGVAFGELFSDRYGSLVNVDAIRPMVRTLLAQRFKLESHLEERMLKVHVLSALKPKLAKGDPANRTRCKNVISEAERTFSCQNISMAQFAETLPSIAPVYLHSDVVDATGLEGSWDFTFSFSTVFALQSGRGGRNADSGAAGPQRRSRSI